jgi:glycosyltransferase involved in cell wall biosynthesis
MKTNRRENGRRVVHLTSVHQPFDVRIFHKECKSIVRAGYDVTLIACNDRDDMVDGVKLKAIPRRSGRLSRMTMVVWAAYREALRQDADLYHFHDPELIPVGLLLRLKGKSVIYDVHENVPQDIAFKHYLPRPLRVPLAWLIGLIEASSSRYFSAIVPATSPISVRFASWNDRTVVATNYPVVDALELKTPAPWAQRSPAVAYTGILTECRCVKEIVQAMAFLPKDLPATLKLAGAFSPKGLGHELARTAGWERVEALGVIERSRVSELLDNVCAGLLICRPDPNSLEAAPNKLFEYMCSGIPVIASDFPGFREIVGGVECGLLVNPLDPKAIARAIEYILTHPAEAEQMGRRGRKAVENTYNWTSEERKLLNLYGVLLDSESSDTAVVGDALKA